MILSSRTLTARLEEFIPVGSDPALVNPASIDIRVGRRLLLERDPDDRPGPGPKRPRIGRLYASDTEKFTAWDLTSFTPDEPFRLKPGQFCLVETYEVLAVPNGYAMDLKLKSSRAREGYDHALAFWFDPGWYGIGTMEVKNNLQHRILPLYCGLRFGQVVVHRLDSDALEPYAGRYNNATGVETAKPGS